MLKNQCLDFFYVFMCFDMFYYKHNMHVLNNIEKVKPFKCEDITVRTQKIEINKANFMFYLSGQTSLYTMCFLFPFFET